MKRYCMTASLVAALSTTGVWAADRTWDGGGANANWSTAANWDGDVAAPAADDALYFGGSTRLVNTNDLALTDPSFAGLTFSSGAGAFALWGSRITLGGNVTNGSSNTQTINLPMVLSGTRDVNASNGQIVVNGALSGPGGLAKYGAQALTLSASNSYDGITTVSTGTVIVTHGSALGSTAGGTTVNTLQGAGLDLRGGITLAEPLTFTGGNNSRNCLVNTSGTNTLSALMTTTGGRHYINGGTALIIAGGITNNPFFVINGTGTLIIRTTPLTMGTGTFYADDYTLSVIDVASNAWGQLTIGKGTVRMNVKDALPPAASIQMGLGYAQLGTFDLNGFDQTTVRLFNGATGAYVVTSSLPATLTINQSTASSTFEGQFTGAAGLYKTGTGTLILTNGNSTSLGRFTVSNGTLAVATTASLNGSTNVVVMGGTLELRHGAALSDSAALAISGNGKLKVSTGFTESVGQLFLNGTQGLKGTYGMSGSGALYTNDVFFSGAGLLNVLSDPPLIATNYVWDAGGGADTYLATAANWTNDVPPDFVAGTSRLIFGIGGSSATVNTNATLYGITFNSDGNFTVANGDGALALGQGGIYAAAPTATGRSYALSEDVTLIDNQTWNATNAVGSTTLTVSGTIGDGTNTLGFTKLGNSALILAGNNTFDGVVTNWCGGIQINHSNALGSTVNGTVINTAGPSSAWISFYGGITLAEPLTFIGGEANGGCLNNNGGTNTVSGLITTAGGRFLASAGTVLNIVGGMVAPTGPQVVFNAQGTIIITNTPLNFTPNGVFWTDSGGLTVLSVASNTWGRLTLTGGTLRTDVENALPTNSILQVGGIWYNPHCTLNLNGFNQTVKELSRAEPTPGTIAITSAVPVTLTVNQNTASGYDGMINGYVSLLKLGTGTLTLTNASTSTAGSFVISNGTLAVGGLAGTLGNNSTNIVVGGTGTLSLQNSKTLADTATLRIANGGGAKVSLAAGVNESVGFLYFGGTQKRAGTYSASVASGAQVIDTEHFAGTGVLTVLHDKSGLMLRLQ